MNADVTRWIEFDAGHRVATHAGKCANLHGHRYRVGVTVRGEIPESGMVLDFGVLGDVLRERVHDRFDHAFIYDEADTPIATFLRAWQWRGVALAAPPTAENLAVWIGDTVSSWLPGFEVVRVEVHETPNSVATWTP